MAKSLQVMQPHSPYTFTHSNERSRQLTSLHRRDGEYHTPTAETHLDVLDIGRSSPASTSTRGANQRLIAAENGGGSVRRELQVVDLSEGTGASVGDGIRCVRIFRFAEHTLNHGMHRIGLSDTASTQLHSSRTFRSRVVS